MSKKKWFLLIVLGVIVCCLIEFLSIAMNARVVEKLYFLHQEKQYLNLIQQDPKHLPYYNQLALIYSRQNKTDRVLGTQLKIVKLEPENPNHYLSIASAYLVKLDEPDTLRHQKSRHWAHKALALAPNDPFVLYGVGGIYGAMGDTSRAVEMYDRALQFFKADSVLIDARFLKKDLQERLSELRRREE